MGDGDVVQSAVDVKDKPIVQIGFVVRDAVKTAKCYAEIFGVSSCTGQAPICRF